MALITQININNMPIYLLVATRLEGGEEPDDENVYRLDIYRGTECLSSSTITHRYGDGALELSRKIHEVAIGYEKFEKEKNDAVVQEA